MDANNHAAILKILRTMSAMEYPVVFKKEGKSVQVSTTIYKVEDNVLILRSPQTSEKFQIEEYINQSTGNVTLVSMVNQMNMAMEFEAHYLSSGNRSINLKIPEKIYTLKRRSDKRITVWGKAKPFSIDVQLLSKKVVLEYRKEKFTFKTFLRDVSVSGISVLISKSVDESVLKEYPEAVITVEVFPGVPVVLEGSILDYGQEMAALDGSYRVLRIKFKKRISGAAAFWLHFLESIFP